MSQFKLILYDLNTNLINEFTKYFSQYPDIEIINSSFADLPKCDCIVSPANSFGMMDGGIDGVFTKYFGNQLMERVQQHIINNYAGEQPIGTSFIIPTYDSKHPYLAHTPTMTLPMDIRGTNNVYQAMKAMLLAVRSCDDINSVACCGLGTATGKISPIVAAKQMSLAYEHVMINPLNQINWITANNRYREVKSI